MSTRRETFRSFLIALLSFQSLLYFTTTSVAAIDRQAIAGTTCDADEGKISAPDSRYVLPRPNGARMIMARSASREAAVAEFPTSDSFQRKLRHFANPVICDMMFCHTSCADYDDSCPSFNHHLLNALDEFGSCASGPKTKLQGLPTADCCVDSLQSPETFSITGSQFK